MNIKGITTAVALGVACVVAPQGASAGGELQAYERPYSSPYAQPAYASYPQTPAPYYGRPAGMYYGGYGCSPCASQPYGYSAGRPGLFGNDILTAGLLGVGLGYLIFH